jgi:hypothetical protein
MVEEVYISVDVEADGRVPGLSSMLSLGAVAITLDKVVDGKFSCNFKLLDGAWPHPKVQEFWHNNKDAYDATRRETVAPEVGTAMLANWLTHVAGSRRAFFVGYPAVYDYKWLDYYTERFLGENPFGHSRAIDVRSFAWSAMAKTAFSHTSKRFYPKGWAEKLPHTHIAVDDALGQAVLFINMLRWRLELPPIEFKQ